MSGAGQRKEFITMYRHATGRGKAHLWGADMRFRFK
jgi:hypothetical protein